MGKIDKFYEAKNLFQCPKCKKKIRFHAGGLVCKKEHTFDIAAKGYVNLLQQTKAFKGYDADFFQSRRRFFSSGYYDHIVEHVVETVDKFFASEEELVVLDAGCGEGGYSAALEGAMTKAGKTAQILAFDIAADAIKVAAGNDNVKWMIADITNIPVKDQVVDCILDVFTPANYKEFNRVLKDGGYLIKVVPGSLHLTELRQAVSDQLQNKEYSNEDVTDYFEDHYQLIERQKLTKTMAIEGQALEDLIRMTPLLFDVDKTKLDVSSIKEITIEAEVLVGKKK
ncbi:MAG: methyltransferase domain-containing protein [Firmicutes bacterium]|nr:methyltransferase domain-containing protein [Bacillota bacterium]